MRRISFTLFIITVFTSYPVFAQDMISKWEEHKKSEMSRCYSETVAKLNRTNAPESHYQLVLRQHKEREKLLIKHASERRNMIKKIRSNPAY